MFFSMEDLFPCAQLAPEQSYMQTPASQTLGLLPVELLDAIASFIPQKSLPNFAIVHSRCRAVAIRHMYATVVLRASSLSVKSKDPANPLPDADSAVPEILASVTIDGCSTLRRVLANDEHIAVIRDFRIVGYPGYSERRYFSAFVKHIWTNTRALNKVDHEYFPADPAPLPDPCWSDTLQHLTTRHICWWTLKALQGSCARRLTLQSCTQTTHKLPTKLFPKNLVHITHFEYLWHDWKGEVQEFNFDWIAEVFPNLTKLRIGVCTCWRNQGIPDKIYERALCKLVTELPMLEYFTIGEAGENASSAEEQFTISLWCSQPALREVKFEWRGGASVSWQRHDLFGNSVSSEFIKSDGKKAQQTQWTPDPTHAGRHAWWFARFGLPEVSRPEMMARWHHKGYHVPSERELYDRAFSIVKAELWEETPCEWATKGKCACAMCSF